ncbi:MAG: DNA polymerase III subunit gamma/tau [Synechococcaceae cyanobacterium]
MAQAYQPLHHKYRPQRLDQLVGQAAITATLGQALRSGRIAPAYLFSGPRGTGKTSSARILARSLNCIGADGPTPEPCGSCELCTSIAAGTALDVIEIDAASNTGVDNIRELIERSRFAPVQARWKVYVVDECHMLSTAAFNALLKTLEEPPPRVVFVLATTDPQRVLPTILSRCQRFDFRRIPLEALEGHLGWIAEREGIGITAEALHVVAQRSQGGLRDAESLLDQLSLLPPPIEVGAVWDLLGAVPEEELLRLAQALAAAEPLPLVEAVRELLERGREPTAVLQGLAGLLRDLLLAGAAPDRLELTAVSPSLRPQLPDVARLVGRERLLRWHSQLRGSEQQLRHSAQPRLWLEVLLLGLLAEPVIAAVAAPASPTPPTQAPTAVNSIRPAAVSPEATSPGVVGSQPPQAPPPAPSSAPRPPASAGPSPAGGVSLAELWQQILAGLELPSTRMLLSQQAQLVHLDDHRLVVRVASTWMAMVQSRKALLQKAITATLGQPRELVLEASQDMAPGVSGGTATPTAPPAAGATLPLPPPAQPPAQAAGPRAPLATPAAPGAAAADPAQPTAAAAPRDGEAERASGAAQPAEADTASPTPPALAGGSARLADPTPASAPGPTGLQATDSLRAHQSPTVAPLGQTPGPQPYDDSGSPRRKGPAASGREPGPPLQSSPLDEKARRLAEFFNGELVDLEGPLPDLHDAA